MLINTSKTRRVIERKKEVAYDRSKFIRQKMKVSEENLQDFLYEKRVKELAAKGFNEDAITGMMKGTKGGSEKGEIRKMMKNKTIQLDGNL